MGKQLMRAQVLLDSEDFQRLRAMAQEQGNSLSEIVREAVLRFLEEQERLKQEEFLKTLEDMRQIREKNASRYGTYHGDLVNEVRREREREIEDVWQQWS